VRRASPPCLNLDGPKRKLTSCQCVPSNLVNMMGGTRDGHKGTHHIHSYITGFKGRTTYSRGAGREYKLMHYKQGQKVVGNALAGYNR
jgi:hypothetical protein